MVLLSWFLSYSPSESSEKVCNFRSKLGHLIDLNHVDSAMLKNYKVLQSFHAYILSKASIQLTPPRVNFGVCSRLLSICNAQKLQSSTELSHLHSPKSIKSVAQSFTNNVMYDGPVTAPFRHCPVNVLSMSVWQDIDRTLTRHVNNLVDPELHTFSEHCRLYSEIQSLVNCIFAGLHFRLNPLIFDQIRRFVNRNEIFCGLIFKNLKLWNLLLWITWNWLSLRLFSLRVTARWKDVENSFVFSIKLHSDNTLYSVDTVPECPCKYWVKWVVFWWARN